jgi:hypothetical protein
MSKILNFKLRSSRETFKNCQTSVQMRKRYEEEKHLTLVAAFLVGFFLLSWSPYAVVSMYCALGDPNDIGPLTATIPALFAKSALLWPSLLYMVGNRNLNNNFKRRESMRLTTFSSNSYKSVRSKTR